MSLSPQDIGVAYRRIKPYIHHTPLFSSSFLNKRLGHDLTFKMENFQKIEAFKIRGALNSLLGMKEASALPQEIVTFSSGNHAQAVAMAGTMLKVKTTIFIPEFASKVKRQAAEYYGAEIILTKSRQEAELRVKEKERKGCFFLHPYNDENIIAGQGTSCFEALTEMCHTPDAIFAACGGGGWLSGTYLAKELLSPSVKVIAGEPALGNDASRSFRAGKIIALNDSPQTIADGARTIAVGDITFSYLQKLDDFIEVSEREIVYWTQWLHHLLKCSVEPTSAVAMAAAAKWLKSQKQKQRVLILISGGNIDKDMYDKIWAENYLDDVPEG